MRILISLSYYYPNVSGLTLYVKNLAESLTKKHHVTVVTSQFAKQIPQEECIHAVMVKRVPVFLKFGKALLMPSYALTIWKEIQKNDIVIINLPQFEGWILAILAKISQKKIICIYHCEVTLTQGLFNRFIQYVLDAANSLSLACSDKVITYTKDYAEHSRLLSHVSHKISYTYPLIAEPKIDTALQESLRQKIPQGKPLHIGVAARVAAEKGFEYLLEAIPFLEKKLGKNFIIIVAGPKNPVGEERYLATITPLIEKYHDSICFLGTVPYEYLGSFYAMLDVLVLASINATEAFGIVQVEAMLCGVPVVATDLPGVRVPIQKTGMGEIVPPKDAEQLAKAIIHVLLHKKMYQKDKLFIQKEFAWRDTEAFIETQLGTLIHQ